MHTKLLIYLVLFSVLGIIESVDARSFRPFQIPNGSVRGCLNCHDNSTGGLPLNDFGKEVGENFLAGDNVNWNETLAMIDSDGDGFTNGEELLDPEGTWKIGDPPPGDPGSVGNPGDENVTPVLSNIFDEIAVKIESISPNPFNETVEIKFNVKHAGKVQVDIYNLNGEFITSLLNDYLPEGNAGLAWNATSYSGATVPQGTYLIRFWVDNNARFEKVFYIK